MATERRPLADLDAVITTVRWGQADDAPRVTCLRFTCPLCGDHQHQIPYRPGVKQHGKLPVVGLVWGHTGGSTVDDLTLVPSYLSRSRSVCTLHIFVRGGVVEVLGDSFKVARNGE